MNSHFAPTYQYLFGDYWVLWYSLSNSYSIIEPSFKTLLDYYLQADTMDSFISKVAIDDSITDPDIIAETIGNYLTNCNKPLRDPITSPKILDTTNRSILKQYFIEGKTIRINYDSDLVLKTIHPSIAHLSEPLSTVINTTFDIYLKNEQLHLFKDAELITCVPKRDYHLIQGKFIMQLLCTIHEKTEKDWISTFHGSTITDGTSSILFIGESGKGKSTLCALLCANDFNLLADDVSPMLSEDNCIYFNPSAISIKQGAFKALNPLIPNFDSLPITKFNRTKGSIKYLPCGKPNTNSYPCQSIILVNYKNEAETALENVTVKTILETIIPDSWISPNPTHAKQFLDWLASVDFYKLTYSDSKSVTSQLSELFKQLDKKL